MTTRSSPQVAKDLAILVAVADADTRALYRDALHLAGCDVVEASDGCDALAKALVREPMLIITELRLPLVDGCALCDILRHDAMTRSVPILVVTTETRATALEHARAAGADAVLVKPSSPDVVVSEARKLLSSDLRARSLAMPASAAAQVETATTVLARSEEHRRRVLVKTYQRFSTTTPPLLPPALVCPSCDQPLKYRRSHIGGVSDRQPEQWDYYVCPASCGTFQYRQRTRKFRRVG